MQFYQMAPGARFEFRGAHLRKLAMSLAEDMDRIGNVFQAAAEVAPIGEPLMLPRSGGRTMETVEYSLVGFYAASSGEDLRPAWGARAAQVKCASGSSILRQISFGISKDLPREIAALSSPSFKLTTQMSPETFQQLTIALERFETTMIITIVVGFLLGLVLNGLVLYLMFGKVLIPLAGSLCNFLDAQAWHIDHQSRPRPGHGDVTGGPVKPKA